MNNFNLTSETSETGDSLIDWFSKDANEIGEIRVELKATLTQLGFSVADPQKWRGRNLYVSWPSSSGNYISVSFLNSKISFKDRIMMETALVKNNEFVDYEFLQFSTVAQVVEKCGHVRRALADKLTTDQHGESQNTNETREAEKLT